MFNEETDVGDVLEDLLPKYLFREQYCKCVEALEEIFLWTADGFYHEMNAYHEIILYNFIEYMSGLKKRNSPI